MKNLSKGLVVLFIALASSTAQAEVTRLGIRFAGGCFTKNSQGSCTIDTVAFGDGFEAAPGLQLFSSDSRNGKFRQLANYKRKLDEFGRARSRLKNIPGGCFQVRMQSCSLTRSQ